MVHAPVQISIWRYPDSFFQSITYTDSSCLRRKAAADAFVETLGPDLVVEVEVTHAAKGKIERYAALGAREFWQIQGRRGDRGVAVDFFALQPDAPPRPLAASEV